MHLNESRQGCKIESLPLPYASNCWPRELVCLEQCFGEIADPRVERTRAHQLLDILAIALFAVLAGVDSWVAIETYGNAKIGQGYKAWSLCNQSVGSGTRTP
ncbi:transposase family protein [Thermocoleostomius sinensis]|uniref:transposase family protein n=1 Tax=Thermocoleostomius sinensis TaxID=3065396 RepID=UPI0036F212E8